MFGKFTRKKKTDSCLDFTGRKGTLLVVTRQTRSFQSKSLKDIVDERVQDGHTTLGDTSVGVHLLQHTVNVSGVRFHTLGLAAFAGLSDLLGLLGSFLSYSRCFGHF